MNCFSEVLNLCISLHKNCYITDNMMAGCNKLIENIKQEIDTAVTRILIILKSFYYEIYVC